MPRIQAYWYRIRSTRDQSPDIDVNQTSGHTSSFRGIERRRSDMVMEAKVDVSKLNDIDLAREFLKSARRNGVTAKIRTNLIDWAAEVMISAGLTPSAHHRFLLNDLDLVTKGKIKRLMILMPPGSAKSTYASVIFPIWWFIQHPLSSVIAASHTATLVEHFSRRIQKLIDEHRHKIGFGLQASDRSAAHWRTDAGGEYFAVGVRGAITGRRADLVNMDDPVKSMAEADSAKHRRSPYGTGTWRS